MIHENAQIGDYKNLLAFEFGKGDISFTQSHGQDGDEFLLFTNHVEKPKILWMNKDREDFVDWKNEDVKAAFIFNDPHSIDCLIATLTEIRTSLTDKSNP